MTTREGYHRFQGGWQPSAAQRRVLDGIAAGRTNVELAAELGLSTETVKWHVSQVLAQTGCADRQALAAWWRAGESVAALKVRYRRAPVGEVRTRLDVDPGRACCPPRGS